MSKDQTTSPREIDSFTRNVLEHGLSRRSFFGRTAAGADLTNVTIALMPPASVAGGHSFPRKVTTALFISNHSAL